MPKRLPPTTAEQLAALVAKGSSLVDAAKALDLPERTARKIAAGDEFKSTVTKIRSEAIDRVVGRLAAAGIAATDTLISLLKSESPPAIRLGAARAILDNLIHVRQHVEIEERLAELEKRAEASASRGR
jgi:hypothetical protein